jgi:hypothetical protein
MASSDLSRVLSLCGFQGDTKTLEWALRLKHAKAVFAFLANLPPTSFLGDDELSAFRTLQQEGKVVSPISDREERDENKVLQKKLQTLKAQNEMAAQKRETLLAELERAKTKLAKRKKMSEKKAPKRDDAKSAEISEEISKVAQQSKALIELHKSSDALIAANQLER